jgi:hypothetical protein
MRNFAFLLAVLALLLGGIAWYQWNAAGTLAAALDRTTAERDSLGRRVADLEKREKSLTQEAAALREQASATSAPAPTAGGRTMTYRVGNAGGSAGPMGALDSPEMRRLMAVGQRGQLDARYAPLFKSLGLPPQQLDRFKQLLVDKQNSAMDVMAAARSQGITPDSRGQLQSLMQQANRELDDGIKNLLGDSAYQQYQQFDRTQTQRAIVDQLATRLSYTDTPLTPQQSEQMVQLLADTAPPAPSAGAQNVVTYGAARIATTSVGAGPAGGPLPVTVFNSMAGGPGASITDEAVNRAQSVLSPTQVGALQQLQAEQQAQQQMGQLMRQSLDAQGGVIHFSSSTDSSPAPPPPAVPGG